MTEHEHIHEHITEQIIWLLNGRLSAAEQQRVLHHLDDCAACRSELALQQAVQGAITRPNKVEIAPQPSFTRLWNQIQDGQRQPALPRRRPVPGLLADTVQWCKAHWMPLLLGTQTLVIVSLSAVLVIAGQRNGSGYYTVTAADHEAMPIIHVVFNDTVQLADLHNMLVKHRLQVAAGPSAVGVYSLSPDAAGSDMNELQAMVAALRADPRVRFAELSHP